MSGLLDGLGPDPAILSALPVVEAVRAAVLGDLVACGYDEPRVSYPAAGLIAWDDCCGTLVVAPERVYRTDSFPDEGVTDRECAGGELAVDLVVLLIRCVPVIDDRGEAPPADELAVAYGLILSEAAVVWNTVTSALPVGISRANVSQTWVGAQGGCIGTETRLSLGLDVGYWCPPCTAQVP